MYCFNRCIVCLNGSGASMINEEIAEQILESIPFVALRDRHGDILDSYDAAKQVVCEALNEAEQRGWNRAKQKLQAVEDELLTLLTMTHSWVITQATGAIESPIHSRYRVGIERVMKILEDHK